jgi:hypothetical protein
VPKSSSAIRTPSPWMSMTACTATPPPKTAVSVTSTIRWSGSIPVVASTSATTPAKSSSSVEVRYKGADRELRVSTLDRVDVDEVLAGVPVREFRWFKGRQFYSGWYWSATGERLLAYESRLELARIMLADFAPEVVGIAAQPFSCSGGIRAGYGGMCPICCWSTPPVW